MQPIPLTWVLIYNDPRVYSVYNTVPIMRGDENAQIFSLKRFVKEQRGTD
jgi:hypothetical protein